jgi:perosamine synthetase
MVCIECEGITLKLRDIFIQELKSRGIDSRPYFYPVSDMPMYSRANTPIAHEVYVKGMNLPSFYDLEEDEVQYICDMIVEILPNIRADRAVSSTLT